MTFIPFKEYVVRRTQSEPDSTGRYVETIMLECGHVLTLRRITNANTAKKPARFYVCRQCYPHKARKAKP